MARSTLENRNKPESQAALDRVMADPLATALDRAFALANSGAFQVWPQIAEQLAREGYAAAAITRIGRNRTTQRELTALMLETEKARAQPQKRGPAKRLSPSLKPDAFMARRR